MAAALALLVVLPILASDGKIDKGLGTSVSPRLNVAVFDEEADIAVATPDNDSSGTVTAGDDLFIDDAGVDPEDTKVGPVLYISNDADAFQVGLVSFEQADETGAKTVEVKNDDSGEKLILTLSTAVGDGKYQGVFFLVAESPGANELAAADGDKIIVTSPKDDLEVETGVIIELIVDGKGPTISAVTPDDGHIQTKSLVTYGATVVDAGSGLRDDSEIPTGGDPDGDSDGITENEPFAIAGGGSADISVFTKLSTDSATSTVDQSSNATGGWAPIDDGYSFSFNQGGHGSDDHYWYIEATDRAGNTKRTDADDDPNDQNHKVTVDDQDPKMDSVETGLRWDSGKDREKADSDGIKVVFINETDKDADRLDSKTIDASDFRIDATDKSGAAVLAIKEVIFPNLNPSKVTSQDVNKDDLDTRNIVYIRMVDDLPPDSKPEVNVVGDLRDKAGNAAPAHAFKASDGILPGMSVSITTEGGIASRPVAIGNSKDEVIIRVTSDEDLTGSPLMWLVDFIFDNSTTDDRLEVNTVTSLSLSGKEVSGLDNTWEIKRDASGLTNRLIGVHVSGLDKNGNRGANKGVKVGGDHGVPKPPEGQSDGSPDEVELHKMKSLFEFDNDIADPDFVLTPNTGTNTETESSAPFIRIDFSESKEYKIANTKADSGNAGDKLKFGTPPEDVEIDTHDTVTLLVLELEDEDGNKTDLLGLEGEVDDDSVVVALSGLTEGSYTLRVDAVDEVGNEMSAAKEFDFEVKERSKYEVSIDPGWNLISLPGTPADPSIDSVLPDSMNASRVLQWVDGAFQVAERGSDGAWDPSSQVTEIVAGPGYWVFTAAFEKIKVLIPERDPAVTLPTVEIVGGWNLVGVVDVSQAKAGKAPADDGVDPDDIVKPDVYFASLDWSVAYSYDTTTRQWTKHTEKTTGSVLNGKGYWVWANKAGTLVP